MVFEKLLMTENGEEVAGHEDLKDQNQTVRLVKKPDISRSVKTGDDSLGKIWISMILASVSGIAAVYSAGRRRKRKI